MTLTYTASVVVHSNTGLIVYFIARDQPNSTNTIVKNSSSPATNHNKITLKINSNEFTGTETALFFRVVNLTDSTIYTDDWTLTYS